MEKSVVVRLQYLLPSVMVRVVIGLELSIQLNALYLDDVISQMMTNKTLGRHKIIGMSIPVGPSRVKLNKPACLHCDG